MLILVYLFAHCKDAPLIVTNLVNLLVKGEICKIFLRRFLKFSFLPSIHLGQVKFSYRPLWLNCSKQDKHSIQKRPYSYKCSRTVCTQFVYKYFERTDPCGALGKWERQVRWPRRSRVLSVCWLVGLQLA